MLKFYKLLIILFVIVNSNYSFSISKKYVGKDQIGSSQILLENNSSLRALNSTGSAENILKLSNDNKLIIERDIVVQGGVSSTLNARVEGHYQQVMLASTSGIAVNTNLNSLTKSFVDSNSTIFTLTASGITLLKDAKITIVLSTYQASNTSSGSIIRVNGNVIPWDISTRATNGQLGANAPLILMLKKDAVITLETSTTVSTVNATILAEARTQYDIYPEVFPTTEIMIGYFKDSPLYKRCFTAIPAHDANYIASGVKDLFRVYGTITWTSLGIISYPYASNDTNYAYAFKSATGAIVSRRLGGGNNSTGNVCLEYTKL